MLIFDNLMHAIAPPICMRSQLPKDRTIVLSVRAARKKRIRGLLSHAAPSSIPGKPSSGGTFREEKSEWCAYSTDFLFPSSRRSQH